MKVKLEPAQQKEREITFPFFAQCENGRVVVMFIGPKSGICLKDGNSLNNQVGRLDNNWSEVNEIDYKHGRYYWQPYHGSITIEV
jgi:hypothetical protein